VRLFRPTPLCGWAGGEGGRGAGGQGRRAADRSLFPMLTLRTRFHYMISILSSSAQAG